MHHRRMGRQVLADRRLHGRGREGGGGVVHGGQGSAEGFLAKARTLPSTAARGFVWRPADMACCFHQSNWTSARHRCVPSGALMLRLRAFRHADPDGAVGASRQCLEKTALPSTVPVHSAMYFREGALAFNGLR